MITPVSPTFLKQEAKKLKKSQGLLMSKALDEVSKNYGFSNYRHYLNVYESNLEQLNFSKEVFLKSISSEKDTLKKINLVVSFVRNFKTPFRESFDILVQLKRSKAAVQSICKELNLMKNEIENYLLNDFQTDEGQCEISFRSPNFIAKNISISELTYKINEGVLCVDGNYALTTEFEFELNEDDPVSNDDRFKNRKIEGSFGVEIGRNKNITLVHSDMGVDNGLTPMRGFTKDEVEEYYNHFPDERGRFDDILVL